MRAFLLVLLALAAPAVAGDRAALPDLLKMTGHLGPARPGETGTTNMKLQVDGTDHQYQLTTLEVLTGNRSASQVLSQVTPYTPAFYLRAPAKLLKRFTDATPADTVVVQGYFRRNSGRNLQASEVVVKPPDPSR
ncbi:MAG TPA: hypothetical protein VGR62_01400 [Candidatus Binatia bacterium]|jgi:hypothetical protein|nr:hypothetical protein [Candidatus Binatia bacterium]